MNHGCTTSIKGLTVVFPDQPVLTDIDMTLHCGEITAIIGPNGAGKTTLLRALMGLIPYTGSVQFASALDGENLRRPKIGYVPQNLHFDRLSPLRVKDVFAACLSHRPAFLGIGRKNQLQAEQALRITRAEHLLGRRLGALSGGELQRVLLALALTPLPQMLLLDEPVSGVDRNGLKMFYDLLDTLRREQDITVLLVSHDVEVSSKYADRMALLGEHKLLCTGTPSEVLASPQYAESLG